MKITFCGVGEAFDENLANTSLLVTVEEAGGCPRNSLLDCGFTAAHSFWSSCADPLSLETVWISHFHGDHFFGLPLLLLRFWEEGRRAPLTVIGQSGVAEKVSAALDLAYPGFRSRLEYGVRFLEASPGRKIESAGLHWSFAHNGHSQPCLAVRVDHPDGRIFYSGDGKPTEDTLILAMGSDLVVHEAYRVEGDTSGHGNVPGCVHFARNAGVPALALVHMQRLDRATRYEEVERIIAETADVEVFLPEPGDVRKVRSGVRGRGKNKDTSHLQIPDL
jgi:ribonuclease Z